MSLSQCVALAFSVTGVIWLLLKVSNLRDDVAQLQRTVAYMIEREEVRADTLPRLLAGTMDKACHDHAQAAVDKAFTPYRGALEIAARIMKDY